MEMDIQYTNGWKMGEKGVLGDIERLDTMPKSTFPYKL